MYINFVSGNYDECAYDWACPDDAVRCLDVLGTYSCLFALNHIYINSGDSNMTGFNMSGGDTVKFGFQLSNTTIVTGDDAIGAGAAFIDHVYYWYPSALLHNDGTVFDILYYEWAYEDETNMLYYNVTVPQG